MANNGNIPFYRDPNDILVPANAVAILTADFAFTTESNPFPVYTDTRDPDMATDTPPIYMSLAGVRVPADAFAILLSDGTFVGPGNPLPTTGGGGGPVDAYDVEYTNTGYPAIENVGEALDTILYVATDITAFNGGSSNEIGSTVHGAHLTWSINKTITSQSLDNGIGSLTPDVRSYDYGPDITSNTTFTLTASDGQTTDHASTTVAFFNKRYWGPSALTSLDDAEIIALSSEFATGRGKAVTYDCTGGQYPFYCYPTSFGALTAVTVGGLAFSDYTQTVQSFTNASGHTENYYVTRFNGIQTGANIQVVWA